MSIVFSNKNIGLFCILYALTIQVPLGLVAPPEARAKVKIYEFDVTILVNDDVVRLDIPVDDAH